jgi:hypothetical protein
MKSHITPDGVRRCTAGAGKCPFGGEDIHFHTKAEALVAYEHRVKQAFEDQASVGVKKRRLSEKEKELRKEAVELSKRLVEARAETTKGIVYDDADPVRAERRLKEAIEYANSRHNDHLVEKLAKATVLPSGSFKLSDGTRVNTDKILQNVILEKKIASERDKVLGALTKVAREGGNTKDKFQVKTARGTYSLTIGEGIDEDAFEKLPKKLRDACSSPKESFNIELARENIAPAKLRNLTTQTQTLDYILGKEPEVGQSAMNVSTEFKGKTTDEKLQSGTQNIADFYDNVSNTHGRLKAMKDYTASGKEAIKTAVAAKKSNTFVPARSQYNGALVSARESLIPAMVHSELTSEEIKKITVVTNAPDITKAKTILPPDVFGKIFKAKKASLRVTETKD